MVAAAIVGAAVVGAGASLAGSSQAAGAANKASNAQTAQQNQTRLDQIRFIQNGTNADELLYQKLNGGIFGDPNNGYLDRSNDFLNTSIGYQTLAQQQADAAQRLGQGPAGQAQLEALPGYQFALAQGLQANQNAMAAKGLGVSGAALKGAATYATGLANSTYGDQFNRLMQGANFTASTGAANLAASTQSANLNSGLQGNLTNSFNRLLGTAQLGENAASNTATTGQLAANAAGGFINAGGQASAAGTVGVGNASTSGVNQFLTQNALNQLTANQGGGGINGAAGVNGLTQTNALGDTSFF